VTLGLIVRATETGLGYQTYEMWRHLRPDVTVCIDVSPISNHRSQPQHLDWYPDAVVTPWSGHRHPVTDDALDALASCDTVLSVETWYDLRIPQQAARSVLYVNPELYRAEEIATDYWAPTSWEIDRLPAGTRVVPMPVATDRPWRRGDGFLAVEGTGAMGDRNGVDIAREAARLAGVPLQVASQLDGRGMAEPWDVYALGDVLVLPRRYGGLSLVAQEAMAAGLAVVMPDCEPNSQWPVMAVRGVWRGAVRVPGGKFPIFEADRNVIAELMRGDQSWKAVFQRSGLQWAAEHSWDVLLPRWEEALR
jgi:hypothetical protein